MNISGLTKAEQLELLHSLEALAKYKEYNKWEAYYDAPQNRVAYQKHMDFFSAQATHSQVMFMAGNRVGKTFAAAYATACHATGRYPEWWPGRTFDQPVTIIVAGDTLRTVRDIIQLELLGPLDNIGTGTIPKQYLCEPKKSRGTNDSVDTIDVMHVNGKSTIYFKSYESGQKAFQGTKAHFIWLDEECDESIYAEALTRTATYSGQMILTMTPLSGPTPLILGFMDAPPESGKAIVSMTWAETPHLSEATKASLISSYPEYQRDARAKGIPQLGSGAIYQVSEERILCEPFAIPKHWKRLYGLDVGWNNTAAAWIAIDPDTDVIYMYSDYKAGHLEPFAHAVSIQSRGKWIHGVIDPAASGASQIDGRQVRLQFENAGLTLGTAVNAVEAGIYEVWTRLSTGKLKIFSTCQAFLEEFRLYRRDEKGKIVKKNDHICDALRYAVMTRTSATTEFEAEEALDLSHYYNVSPYGRVGL